MNLIVYMLLVASLVVLLNSAFVCRPTSKGAYTFYIGLAFLIYMGFTVFRPIAIGIGGTDSHHYQDYFLAAKGSLSHGLSVQFYERGYAVFVWLIRQFTSSYRVLLFIVHGFIFTSTIALMKRITFNKYSWITLSALVFLALYSVNTIRIILAVAIVYHVYIRLLDGKLYTAILLAIIALSVHISAAIALPMGLVYIIKRNEKNYDISSLLKTIIIFVLGTFVLINMADFCINQTKYIFYDADEGIAFPSFIMFLVVFIYALIAGFDKSEDKVLQLFTYLLPVGLVILPLQYRYAIMYRMLFYVQPLVYTLIPALLEKSDQQEDRKLLRLIMRLLLFIFVLYRFYSFFSAEMVDLVIFKV